ncbi:hypothetical protein F5148DRAFT_1217239 [Russula earlei]|uniref:Uncharacterized protein n=1 Tax=Russula earlei TaxID=71964 RepID=A0ACC0U4M0_9AGAM|nr:hypothetical protein F5148DRAFT_1217239 [Russula earlei]
MRNSAVLAFICLGIGVLSSFSIYSISVRAPLNSHNPHGPGGSQSGNDHGQHSTIPLTIPNQPGETSTWTFDQNQARMWAITTGDNLYKPKPSWKLSPGEIDKAVAEDYWHLRPNVFDGMGIMGMPIGGAMGHS